MVVLGPEPATANRLQDRPAHTGIDQVSLLSQEAVASGIGPADARSRKLPRAEPVPLSGGPPGKASAVPDASAVPLLVALDDVLIRTNVTIESCLVLARHKPLWLLLLPFWLARGRARFKRRLAQEVMPEIATLPYNHELVAYLREQRDNGRRLALLTGADRAVAQRVVDELKLFDLVLASDGATDLTGRHSRDRLLSEFGEKGFDCVVGSGWGSEVKQIARKVMIVGPAPAGPANLVSDQAVERVFEVPGAGIGVHLHALRPHHWFKSSLVFVPLLLDHRLYDLSSFPRALAAFVAISLCASAIYLLNDLLDLPDDRRHPYKKDRMLASGRLPVGHALAMVPLLLLAAGLVAVPEPGSFFAVMAAYLALMAVYSLGLSRLRGWDVLILATGYCLRVVAGIIAGNVESSAWLLAACFLLFLGLALLKRYAEMVTIRSLHGLQAFVRAYAVADSRRVAILGELSCFLALLISAVHLAAAPALHARYELDWILLALLMFWLIRMWALAGLGEIRNDPVAFALTDRVSRLVGVLMVATALVAG